MRVFEGTFHQTGPAPFPSYLQHLCAFACINVCVLSVWQIKEGSDGCAMMMKSRGESEAFHLTSHRASGPNMKRWTFAVRCRTMMMTITMVTMMVSSSQGAAVLKDDQVVQVKSAHTLFYDSTKGKQSLETSVTWLGSIVLLASVSQIEHIRPTRGFPSFSFRAVYC